MRRRPLAAAVLAVIGLGPVALCAGSYEDFFHAIEQDNAQSIVALLQRGFDPNTLNEKLIHPLVLAIEADASKVLAALLQAKSLRINHLNASGESALMMAALRDKPEMVKLLLAARADVNKTGWTALHYACTAGSKPIVAMLLEAHAYIDAESPNGTTPLMMAAHYGNERVVKLLLDEGADPTLKNQQGLSALDFALSVMREDSAALIRQAQDKWGKR